MELNSLDRYVKSSPQFVLEEHSHCEVPAGCGGAVLRWRDRFTSVPVQLNFGIVGAEDWDTVIDHERPRSARPLLAPGRHVVMVSVRGVVEGDFAFLVWFTSPDVGDDPLLWTPGPDGGWRVTGDEPDEAAWTDVDLDVSTWLSCVPTEVADTRDTKYSVRQALRLGAGPLTVPAAVVDDILPRVWIRAILDVPAPE